MAHIKQLVLYPVKSCAGIALQEATITAAGLTSNGIADREWMVVDMNGHFLTQRECPAMATIVPRLGPCTLTLRAPNAPDLELVLATGLAIDNGDAIKQATISVALWDDLIEAVDCGNEAAAWFVKALGVQCRLVRFDPRARRIASMKWTGGLEVPTRFADGFPILMIGQASLDDLNHKLVAQGRTALPMNRFRPNIVLDGIGPFEEDYAESMMIGPVCLKPVKPCPRCPIPSVNQDTGLVGPDPLDILQHYRASRLLNGAITFGMNVIVVDGDGQKVQLGQECDLSLAF